MKQNIVMRAGPWIFGLMLLLGTTVAAHALTQTEERADCPGKVVCPLTGEDVCKDRCPLVKADRPDYPGRVECPLTGEPVCKDQCPVESVNAAASELPPCCQSKGEQK